MKKSLKWKVVLTGFLLVSMASIIATSWPVTCAQGVQNFMRSGLYEIGGTEVIKIERTRLIERSNGTSVEDGILCEGTAVLANGDKRGVRIVGFYGFADDLFWELIWNEP